MAPAMSPMSPLTPASVAKSRQGWSTSEAKEKPATMDNTMMPMPRTGADLQDDSSWPVMTAWFPGESTLQTRLFSMKHEGFLETFPLTNSGRFQYASIPLTNICWWGSSQVQMENIPLELVHVKGVGNLWWKPRVKPPDVTQIYRHAWFFCLYPKSLSCMHRWSILGQWFLFWSPSKKSVSQLESFYFRNFVGELGRLTRLAGLFIDGEVTLCASFLLFVEAFFAAQLWTHGDMAHKKAPTALFSAMLSWQVVVDWWSSNILVLKSVGSQDQVWNCSHSLQSFLGRFVSVSIKLEPKRCSAVQPTTRAEWSNVTGWIWILLDRDDSLYHGLCMFMRW